MNIRDFKIGMKIRISIDPSKSIRKFKGSYDKRKMAGTVQEITQTRYDVNAIQVKRNGSGNSWTIHLDDIRKITPLPKIKPVTFDPNQLVFD